ncbi:MAG: cytidylate kinase-like family protein [Rikenellaceae bacterium]
MEKKFIINLGRELGSGGRDIGVKVAESLGIEFYDKKLIKLAAKQSGISDEIFERVDEHSQKKSLSTLLSYLRNPFTGSDAAANNVLSAEALFTIQSDVIREIASRDSALFVGRCADYILRDHPLSVNIFITAGRADRIARIAMLHSISEREAERMIDRCDESRASYYNFYGTGQWGHASSYDLCVNSSLLGLDQTADYIIDFIRRRLALESDSATK